MTSSARTQRRHKRSARQQRQRASSRRPVRFFLLHRLTFEAPPSLPPRGSAVAVDLPPHTVDPVWAVELTTLPAPDLDFLLCLLMDREVLPNSPTMQTRDDLVPLRNMAREWGASLVEQQLDAELARPSVGPQVFYLFAVRR